MQVWMVQTYTEENWGQQIMSKILIWCVKRKMDIMCFVIGDIQSLG